MTYVYMYTRRISGTTSLCNEFTHVVGGNALKRRPNGKNIAINMKSQHAQAILHVENGNWGNPTTNSVKFQQQQ